MSRNIQRKCRKDKEDYINNICEEIERYGHFNETREFFWKVKLLAREFKPHHYAIGNENGTLVSDLKMVLETWQKYCTELFKGSATSNVDPKAPNFANHEPDILPAEVEEAIEHKEEESGMRLYNGRIFLQALGQ